jgi:hypothetical protein
MRISNTTTTINGNIDNGNDARFCIRNVNSAVVGTDIETEVFTGKNCNISCTGTLTVTGATTINNNMTINGDLYLKNNTWHRSVDGVFRKYYATNEISYYCCDGTLEIQEMDTGDVTSAQPAFYVPTIRNSWGKLGQIMYIYL